MNKFSTLLTALGLILGTGNTRADTSLFTNSNAIAIQSGTAPTSANPYPSTINVPATSGIVTKLTIQLTGLTHSYPSDIDLLLVAPNGTQSLLMSDAGWSYGISNITIALDDDAPGILPEGTTLSTGTYRPANYGTGDTFPAPAPTPGSNSTLAVFKGINPTGVWSLYVVDDTTGNIGSIASWTLNITTQVPAEAGQMIISELRLRGPNGANDEFIEIQNATDTAHTVQSVDGSSGYSVAASDGVVRFIIPNGTVIPARGHYLGVNGTSYGLSSYPAGNGTTATGDASYFTDIPDNAGIALFRTSNPANFTLANRLDAVGSTSESKTLYKEGTGYPALSAFNIDYSCARDLRNGGLAKDTNNNTADFLFADTNGTSAGAGQRLGAPGPENLSSPIRLSAGTPIVRRLVDPAVALTVAPNRVRDYTADFANSSTYGTLLLTRTFVNYTGTNLTRLRFRIVDLTTFPSPTGVADLRPRTSTDATISLSAGSALARGTTLEQPPAQINGGGFNSTFSVNAITQAAPLTAGTSVNARFLFGIEQKGSYRIAIIPETLPATASGMWVISGNTENASLEVETIPPASITSVTRQTSDVMITHLCPPGVLYQLQRSTDLTTWLDLALPVPGTGQPTIYPHTGGAAPSKQFYRLMQVP